MSSYQLSSAGSIIAAGNVTAAEFFGSGAGLTNIPPGQIVIPPSAFAVGDPISGDLEGTTFLVLAGTNIQANAPIIMNSNAPIYHDLAQNTLIYGSPQQTTSDAVTPVLLSAFPIQAANSALVYFEISSFDTTDGASSACYSGYYKVKNLAGVLTISALQGANQIVDVALATASVSVAAVSNSITFYANGVAATNIKWVGLFRVVQA